MAGYTDRAMRLVCREFGAEYTVTEMVSATAVVFGDKKTFKIARIREDEGDVGLQIFGSDPKIIKRGTEMILEEFFRSGYSMPSAIDINMGCPVKKIFSNGEGSALMRDPELIYRITAAAVSASSLPVTVKMRAGIDSEHINAVECALAAEGAGASLVAIHGRTRAQLYGGVADREIIAKVKAALRVPVVANGDITDAESAIGMLKETNADGIMIGRAAVGDPFIFAEIKSALSGEDIPSFSLEKRKEIALRQLALAVEDKGEAVAVAEARKQIANYFKGFRGSAALRASINTAVTFSEVERAVSLVDENEV
jgi:nifR3 family TIM-barrel protein